MKRDNNPRSEAARLLSVVRWYRHRVQWTDFVSDWRLTFVDDETGLNRLDRSETMASFDRHGQAHRWPTCTWWSSVAVEGSFFLFRSMHHDSRERAVSVAYRRRLMDDVIEDYSSWPRRPWELCCGTIRRSDTYTRTRLISPRWKSIANKSSKHPHTQTKAETPVLQWEIQIGDLYEKKKHARMSVWYAYNNF